MKEKANIGIKVACGDFVRLFILVDCGLSFFPFLSQSELLVSFASDFLGGCLTIQRHACIPRRCFCQVRVFASSWYYSKVRSWRSHAVCNIIMKISPCDEDPLTPLFYIVKLGFTGVCIFFFALKHQ